ncbi:MULTISPECIES: TrmH family RNA methyltransferase [Thermomonospora]|uniref:tRNA/rRNA methyltransferase (SpoU) n=1 Tax=Thermomonospora curvata (strain ATCC 19995 / DSM 43183 / JCM 3096 / KCTC 9072 / NBRC 15933 / NCIMB 10081 / Henssen B9) TaxID=471852 RepID=D1A9F0_THECD|nr:MULTISPECIES: RNA methyltransferase [Thermomonospora]ACY96846.1 tRNA/rRNA methyltransferase (SpoU) [Thermomonospora curvata DSM 43183]PKK15138.1 MAG: RNA methyltransferase [Thermomonospora sp. CIF 1]
MATVIPVEDPADPRLTDYTRLRDVQLRKSLEAEHGLFIAEGEKVIRRAVRAGYPVRSVLTSRRWLEPLSDLLEGVQAPVYLADERVLEGVAGFPVHRGALAAMARTPLPSVPELIAAARRVLVLEDLVDHGNVGAIYRCAAALGVDAVVLSPRCADPLYRRAVKVSMGAVFAIPYARMDDWYHGLGDLRAAGFRLLALTPDQSAVPIDKAVPAAGERVALLLGSEGDGLSSRWLKEADEAVCIPMSPDAMDRGVDSLNVVAAASIACYGLMRS